MNPLPYTRAGAGLTVALYARVSTQRKQQRPEDPKPQNPETQLLPLRQYAAQCGFIIAGEYVDAGYSGAKTERPALDKMMVDAKRRKFKAVLVWKFDRFARSVKHLVLSLEEFNHLGVSFVSITENIDTGSPMGKAMFAIIAAMAELERDLISERVSSGYKRWRAERPNAPWGRRALQIKEPMPIGMSLRAAARMLGVSKSTIARMRHSSIVTTKASHKEGAQ